MHMSLNLNRMDQVILKIHKIAKFKIKKLRKIKMIFRSLMNKAHKNNVANLLAILSYMDCPMTI